MRTIAKAALCLFAALLLGSAQGEELAPDVLVKNVTLEVVELIAKDKEIRGNRNKLIQLIDEKVLPHFNFTGMTALAMGQSWNKANAEQKKRLTEEFKTLLNVRVLQSGAQPVPIDYSMEKTAAGWKVYDVMVGGVSLVANYRTEFNNTVRESGIDGLIKSLSAKNRTFEAAGTAPQK